MESGTSKGLWAEAIATANCLQNTSPSKGLNGCIPFEVFHKVSSNVCHLKEFGSRVFVLNKMKTKGKFESKPVEATMVSY